VKRKRGSEGLEKKKGCIVEEGTTTLRKLSWRRCMR
jgi:hypothetical protein